MEKEIASKIFMIENYNNKEEMEFYIKKYMEKLRKDYPSTIVTREFYKGHNVFVRATEITPNVKSIKNDIENQEELEKEEVRIKERGINGIGENVCREKNNGRSRSFGHNGGNARERGSR